MANVEGPGVRAELVEPALPVVRFALVVFELGTVSAPKIVEGAIDSNVDRHRGCIRSRSDRRRPTVSARPRAGGATRWSNKASIGQVVERGAGIAHLERTELSHGYAIDRDHHPLTGLGSSHQVGKLASCLSNPQPSYRWHQRPGPVRS